MHLHLILLDFLRRWWWLVAIFAVVTLVTTMARAPIIISPLAYVALSNDFQAGLLRTVRTLPVSRRGQAMTLWFISVWLLPLIALFILPWGVGLEWSESSLKDFGTLGNQPWFSAAAAWWLQLGSSALLFLLFITAQVGMSSVAGKKFVEAILGLAVAVSFFGCIWTMGLLPRRMDQMHATLWMWMGLVPIVVLLSALASWHWAKRPFQSAGSEHRPSRPREREKTNPGALTGMPLLVMETQLRSLGVYLLMVLLVWAVTAFVSKDPEMKQMIRTDQQSLMFIFVLNCALLPNALNLRMLRALPLSTPRLALVLLSMPASIGAANALLAAAFGAFGHDFPAMAMQCAIRAAAVAGVGGLILGTSLYLSPSSALFVMPVLVVVTMGVSFMTPPLPPLAMLMLGLASIAGAFFLLRLVLDRSSKAYRPRRPLGVQLDRASA